MIIYHKTNGVTSSTTLMMGFGSTNVTHGTFVWNKHKEMVDKLTEDGDVFVTGATHVGAVYSGEFVKRSRYKRYIGVE
jgi:hypothetical protein